MKVYFIRHGESVANLNKVMAGQTDMPLTARGERQARDVGEHLRRMDFDAVYASDLSRAYRTCELALPDCKYVTDARLREIDVGDLVGLSAEECNRRYGAAHIEAREQLDFSAYGGESRAELLARIRAFLADLERTGDTRVAVFTHGGLMLALLEAIWGLAVSGQKIHRANCMVSALEYTEGVWRLYGWNMFDDCN